TLGSFERRNHVVERFAWDEGGAGTLSPRHARETAAARCVSSVSYGIGAFGARGHARPVRVDHAIAARVDRAGDRTAAGAAFGGEHCTYARAEARASPDPLPGSLDRRAQSERTRIGHDLRDAACSVRLPRTTRPLRALTASSGDSRSGRRRRRFADGRLDGANRAAARAGGGSDGHAATGRSRRSNAGGRARGFAFRVGAGAARAVAGSGEGGAP